MLLRLAPLLLLAGCALPEPTLNALPRPVQAVDPAAARKEECQAALAAAILGACNMDPVLAALHARADVAETLKSILFHPTDSDNLADRLVALWTLADGGALVQVEIHGERDAQQGWRLTVSPAERTEPPSKRPKERAAW